MFSNFLQFPCRALTACLAAVAVLGLTVPSHAQQQRVQSADFSRFVFEGGGGFTAPPGGTGGQLTYGWNAMGGVGYRTSRDLSTIAEYQFDRFGIPGNVLNALGEPDGNVHVWSLTLNEKLNLARGGALHPYLIGGGGFYRKLVSFTQPVTEIGTYCDPYYGCYPVEVTNNVLLSHSSSNQGGLDVGAGFEHRLSAYSNAKIFAEARYNWVDTPGNATQMIPVTFGLRF